MTTHTVAWALSKMGFDAAVQGKQVVLQAWPEDMSSPQFTGCITEFLKRVSLDTGVTIVTPH